MRALPWGELEFMLMRALLQGMLEFIGNDHFRMRKQRNDLLHASSK